MLMGRRDREYNNNIEQDGQERCIRYLFEAGSNTATAGGLYNFCQEIQQ